jgi:uncharacterized surface protein with fasciclin (FAS1) repeats
MKNLKFNSRLLILSAIIGITVFATSCSKDQDVAPSSSSSADVLKNGNGAPAPGTLSIAQIAINEGFSELVAALTYVDAELNAGLVELFLNGTDQYTVFAPTNEAFFALYGALGVDEITDLPAELVLDVLLYHVTEGRRAANSVVPKKGLRTIETLLEETFTVNPQAMITAIGNTAYITTPNISASNGIIHVIDAVILPI